MTAFDRSDRDGISDQPSLEAGFDREQAAYALQHCHYLSKQHANGGVPPFLN